MKHLTSLKNTSKENLSAKYEKKLSLQRNKNNQNVSSHEPLDSIKQ